MIEVYKAQNHGSSEEQKHGVKILEKIEKGHI